MVEHTHVCFSPPLLNDKTGEEHVKIVRAIIIVTP